ncbi:MAG: hypothetical protein MH825_10980 [Cyanobacteria bacterium]|nr:hypothetical protein [Cyanobacteriota bacterium]
MTLDRNTQLQALLAEIDAVLLAEDGDRGGAARPLLEQVRSTLEGWVQSDLTAIAADRPEFCQALLGAVEQEVQDLRDRTLTPMESELGELRQQQQALAREISTLEQQRQYYQSLAQQQANQEQLIGDFLGQLRERLEASVTEQVLQMLAAVEPRDRGNTLDAQQLEALQSRSDTVLTQLQGTLDTIFKALQANAQRYEAALNASLERIHVLGQESEAILEHWLNRLAATLDDEAFPEEYGDRYAIAGNTTSATPLPYPGVEVPPDPATVSDDDNPFQLGDLDLSDLSYGAPAATAGPGATTGPVAAPPAAADDLDFSRLSAAAPAADPETVGSEEDATVIQHIDPNWEPAALPDPAELFPPTAPAADPLSQEEVRDWDALDGPGAAIAAELPDEAPALPDMASFEANLDAEFADTDLSGFEPPDLDAIAADPPSDIFDAVAQGREIEIPEPISGPPTLLQGGEMGPLTVLQDDDLDIAVPDFEIGEVPVPEAATWDDPTAGAIADPLMAADDSAPLGGQGADDLGLGALEEDASAEDEALDGMPEFEGDLDLDPRAIAQAESMAESEWSASAPAFGLPLGMGSDDEPTVGTLADGVTFSRDDRAADEAAIAASLAGLIGSEGLTLEPDGATAADAEFGETFGEDLDAAPAAETAEFEAVEADYGGPATPGAADDGADDWGLGALDGGSDTDDLTADGLDPDGLETDDLGIHDLASDGFGADDLDLNDLGSGDLDSDELMTDDPALNDLDSDGLETDDLGIDDLDSGEFGADDLGLDDLDSDDLDSDELMTDDLTIGDLDSNEPVADDFDINAPGSEGLEADDLGLDDLDSGEIETDDLAINDLDSDALVTDDFDINAPGSEELETGDLGLDDLDSGGIEADDLAIDDLAINDLDSDEFATDESAMADLDSDGFATEDLDLDELAAEAPGPERLEMDEIATGMMDEEEFFGIDAGGSEEVAADDFGTEDLGGLDEGMVVPPPSEGLTDLTDESLIPEEPALAMDFSAIAPLDQEALTLDDEELKEIDLDPVVPAIAPEPTLVTLEGQPLREAEALEMSLDDQGSAGLEFQDLGGGDAIAAVADDDLIAGGPYGDDLGDLGTDDLDTDEFGDLGTDDLGDLGTNDLDDLGADDLEMGDLDLDLMGGADDSAEPVDEWDLGDGASPEGDGAPLEDDLDLNLDPGPEEAIAAPEAMAEDLTADLAEGLDLSNLEEGAAIADFSTGDGDEAIDGASDIPAGPLDLDIDLDLDTASDLDPETPGEDAIADELSWDGDDLSAIGEADLRELPINQDSDALDEWNDNLETRSLGGGESFIFKGEDNTDFEESEALNELVAAELDAVRGLGLEAQELEQELMEAEAQDTAFDLDAGTILPDFGEPTLGDEPENLSEDFTADLPEGLTDGLTDDFTADLPDDLADGLSPDLTDDLSLDLTDDLSPDLTADLADDLADDLGGDFTDDLPDGSLEADALDSIAALNDLADPDGELGLSEPEDALTEAMGDLGDSPAEPLDMGWEAAAIADLPDEQTGDLGDLTDGLTEDLAALGGDDADLDLDFETGTTADAAPDAIADFDDLGDLGDELASALGHDVEGLEISETVDQEPLPLESLGDLGGPESAAIATDEGERFPEFDVELGDTSEVQPPLGEPMPTPDAMVEDAIAPDSLWGEEEDSLPELDFDPVSEVSAPSPLAAPDLEGFDGLDDLGGDLEAGAEAAETITSLDEALGLGAAAAEEGGNLTDAELAAFSALEALDAGDSGADPFDAALLEALVDFDEPEASPVTAIDPELDAFLRDAIEGDVDEVEKKKE